MGYPLRAIADAYGEPIRHLLRRDPIVEPSVFTTAKGSRYLMLPDGTTIRNKAARPEHPGEVGWQERSERTYFITPEDADRLSILQTHNQIPAYGGPLALVQDAGDQKRLAVVVRRAAEKPLIVRDSIVNYTDAPSSGMVPLETWDNGTQHFGNDITGMDDTADFAALLEQALREMRRR